MEKDLRQLLRSMINLCVLLMYDRRTDRSSVRKVCPSIETLSSTVSITLRDRLLRQGFLSLTTIL